jgi:choline dehydrogenase-like flavoprotein
MPAAQVTVVGAGLAGSEAAWQIAQRDVPVRLLEMRPTRKTAVHQTSDCAELVCSNFEVARPGDASRRWGECARSLEDPGVRPGAPRTAGGAPRSIATASPRPSPRRWPPSPHRARAGRGGRDPDGGVVEWPARRIDAGRSRACRTDYYLFDAIAPVIEADSIDRDVVLGVPLREGRRRGPPTAR